MTIIYGTETGLHEFNSVLWTEDHEGFPGSARSHDVFGYDLVAGNFGKGPEQDLVIGAPGRDVSGQNGAGAMFVLYGSPGGAQNEGAQMFTEATEGVPANPALNDGLGGSLAAGNLGHGGRSDLVAGMPTKDHGHIDNGMALVLYGTPDGLSAAHAQVWYEEKVAVQSGDGDEFGLSLIHI